MQIIIPSIFTFFTIGGLVFFMFCVHIVPVNQVGYMKPDVTKDVIQMKHPTEFYFALPWSNQYTLLNIGDFDLTLERYYLVHNKLIIINHMWFRFKITDIFDYVKAFTDSPNYTTTLKVTIESILNDMLQNGTASKVSDILTPLNVQTNITHRYNLLKMTDMIMSEPIEVS